MASRTRQPFFGICGRRRKSDKQNDSARGQYTRRWRPMARYPLIFSVLLFGILTFPTIAVSIDYGAFTWSKWNEMHTSTSGWTAIRRMYRSGPRVRAKILVSTPVAMSNLQTNAALFCQQIKNFMEVETVDRVLLEYLQTEAKSETEQGVYYVAVGISALPPPQTTANSELMLPAIEAERGRIADILKYGKFSPTGNVTIDSLWMFGKPMTLVDVVLDGESFIQIYLKPWLGLQLVIASVSSTSIGGSDHYTMDRDAFQDLRLRYLLAKRLSSLSVRVSDIIIHSPTELLPFTTYNAHAGILEIELHVNNLQYAGFVEMYLHSDNSSTTIAQDFNEMEPQWELLAMDIDTKAGELVYPSDSDDGSSSVNIPVLTFNMFNVSWARLERSKGAILDFLQEDLASIGPCRVRFGRIDFPSAQTNLATNNDKDDADKSIFDPVNAINWTLSFIVDPEGTASFDHQMIANYIRSQQGAVELSLHDVLGIADSPTASVEFIGTSNGLGGDSTVNPFISFVLTIRVASSTILESPNFFQLHLVRSALVLLLQQVAVQNDQVTFVSADVVDWPSNEPESSWDRLLLVRYRITITDESQRRGIRSIVFSYRLATTIALYSGETLELIEREIDEGWPIWPQFLPGLFIKAELGTFSNGFATYSTTLLNYKPSFIYDFTHPESNSSSGLVVDSPDVCYLGGTASPGVCIKLRVTGSTQVAPIFLRKLQSLDPVSSSSIGIPPASSARSSSLYPAPWIGGQSTSGDTWTLYVNSSSTFTDQALRFTFATVYTMENFSAITSFTLDLDLYSLDTAATLLISRPVGDLAVAATSDEPVSAFISAELPEVTSTGDESTSVSITLNLQEPRLGGLYSPTLLGTVAPACTECVDFLADCNNKLECREFSACASALFDNDLTLISTLIQGGTMGGGKDVSWLLMDCLTPLDGTVWSSTMSKVLVSSFTCFWQNHCPLVYDQSSNRQFVLEYQHGEQVLTFQLVAGHASLSFTLESTYEFMEDFTANATVVTAQLDAVLTEMYRAAESNVATVKSTLTTSDVAATGIVTAHLTIRYLFLGRLPLPLVEITQSSSNYATVMVTAWEALHLRMT
ncbi:hypothetical protein P3T76_007754 [Phytophthora citrophthora]|uniref:Uncharacterized protein n=1 Tax=Phytophthora citrophthora TaxID=4793 RepID=A0AAD9LLB1_9STRA|nr:hypothetical protein P3T76_007754 [Phytophthora citrophthora]